MNVNLKSMMQLIEASKKRNKKLSRRLIEEWQKFIHVRPRKQIKLLRIFKRQRKLAEHLSKKLRRKKVMLLIKLSLSMQVPL